jgi:hypothetical protein
MTSLVRSQPFASPTQKCLRWQAVAVWLMRLIMVVLAAELSGGIHAALDLAVVVGVVEHPADDCEREGRECPPGCPSCHCSHSAAAYRAPVLALPHAVLPPLACSADRCFSDALIPSSPDRARLDRPPRPSVLHS